MLEAKCASLTMLPCHRGLFCIWVRCCVVCFSILHKRSRSTDLVSWDIRHQYSRPIHSKKSPSNAHPWCSYKAGHRPTADTSDPERNGRVRGWKEEKKIATCVERTVTLTRSAHSFQYPLLLPRLDLPGIRRMDRLHLQEFAASSCARNSLQCICVYETKYIMYLSRIRL